MSDAPAIEFKLSARRLRSLLLQRPMLQRYGTRKRLRHIRRQERRRRLADALATERVSLETVTNPDDGLTYTSTTTLDRRTGVATVTVEMCYGVQRGLDGIAILVREVDR